MAARGGGWGGGILTMGTRSQKKGDKIRELYAVPALHSTQKATQEGEIPQPLCQFPKHRLQPAILHEPAFSKAFLDMPHRPWINLSTPMTKEGAESQGWLADLEARAR